MYNVQYKPPCLIVSHWLVSRLSSISANATPQPQPHPQMFLRMKIPLLSFAPHDRNDHLQHIADTNQATSHVFFTSLVEPDSTVQTNGLQVDHEFHGFGHNRQVQDRQRDYAAHLLPLAHRVISLLIRWQLGIHQGTVVSEYLQDFHAECKFQFNCRTSLGRFAPSSRLAGCTGRADDPTMPSANILVEACGVT